MTCNQASDCAPGQICGEDGLCAAAEIAGRCASIAAPADAGVDSTPPMQPDAMPDARPDAWPQVTLWVRIDGRGTVSIPGTGSCDAGSGQADCPFAVNANLPITLHATPKMHWRFVRWSEACEGQPTSTCAISPSTNASVGVRFENADD